MSERPMAERHEWPGGFALRRTTALWEVEREGNASTLEIEREVLRVAAERDAATAAVAVLEENRREWLAWADSRKADLAAAEQRGAALAVEQCRRLALEAADRVPARGDADGYYPGQERALRDFADILPASPGLAEEVRRLEERGAAAAAIRTFVTLSKPLDQPERLRCGCGCDHFKVNCEGTWDPGIQASINSVECERCHEIYTVNVADLIEGGAR